MAGTERGRGAETRTERARNRGRQRQRGRARQSRGVDTATIKRRGNAFWGNKSGVEREAGVQTPSRQVKEDMRMVECDRGKGGYCCREM